MNKAKEDAFDDTIDNHSKARRLSPLNAGRFQALVEATGQIVWAWDPEGGRSDFERSQQWWEELTGQTIVEQQSVENAWLQKVHNDDREAAREKWATAVKNGVTYDSRFRVQSRSGRWHHIHTRGVPVVNSEGAVVEWIGTLNDVTDQVEAAVEREQLFAEAESERKRLLEVFRHAPSFIAVLRGPNHVFERVNERYVEIVGGRDVVGKPAREALPEVEGQGYFELLDQVYRSGQPHVAADAKITLRNPTGESHRVLQFVYQPMFAVDGSVSGVIAQGIDLTEQRQAEEGLARVTEESEWQLSQLMIESEQRRRLYETILSNTPDFVYVFSLDHRIIYANQSLLTMWGVSWDEAIGKTFMDVGYEKWHADMHCREIDTVRDTKQSIRGEVPFDGTHGVRIYDYIFVPVLGADGEVEAVAGTTRDVTQRRELEDALRATDRRKDEFLAMLAHELRNPLVPIRSGLDILTLDPGVHRETIELMKEQMYHIIRLVDDLLDVSRIMQNKVELRKEPVQVAQLCKRSIEAVRSIIESHRHELVVSLPNDPLWINADPVRLVQVLGNLLNNAAKYMHAGGRIELSAKREGQQAIIRVRDTGIGIEGELLPRVFELFTQASRSLDRAQGGLGIGLTLVQRLVQMHEGFVTAESEGPGRGSLFTVRLPVCDAPSSEVTQAIDTQSAVARRIVVVDDNRSASYLISKLLTMIGKHEVTVANDGESALSTIEKFAPEIVFLDIGLPGMDGYAVCRAIRQLEDGQNLLLVALTGYGQAEDRVRSKDAGFDEHIVKPPSVEQIREILFHPKLNEK